MQSREGGRSDHILGERLPLAYLSVPSAIFPILMLVTVKHVPSWVPGANFQRVAARWKRISEEFVTWPLNHVKQALVTNFYPYYTIRS
jgi:hypothetical protein